MIKAIIFDFGGVIVRERYNAAILTQKWLTAEEKAEYQRIEDTAAKGLMGKDEMFARYYKIFGLNFMADLDVDTPRAYADPTSHMIDLVEKLKENYKVGMLSNNFAFWARILKQQDYFKLFNVAVISSDVGLTKPDPQIYKLVASRLGVETSECIHIDDLPQNVEGADGVGMTGVQFTNYLDLLDKLKALNITGV